MFSSFTSILSPAIKEKLGIGPKPATSPVKKPPRPLSPCNSSKLRPLPPTIQSEVQSPGFSSRLTNLVRRQESQMDELCLSPRQSRMMSRAGHLPLVSLTRRQPPRLTSRNSDKFGRTPGRSPVTLRIAPSEPFSPFKRYSGTGGERGVSLVRGKGGQEQREGSTDPRQVIAVLAELSGKRTRRPSDEHSINGSKRARRDSSSSLGSSLSMEMPPLFSNGVVGQTTSHLVSRETDLSLGNLLSRNQTLFGGHHHPMVGMGPPPPAPVPTVNAQSQTNGGGLGSKSSLSGVTSSQEQSRAIAAELEASLSSSRCMLKRGREEMVESEESGTEEEETVSRPAKKTNVFRSPDKGERRRRSGTAPPGSDRSSSKEKSADISEKKGDQETGKVKPGGGATGIMLPSPEDVLGTPSRRSSRARSQVIGEKEIRGEKELQRKRLEKMLDIFPDQREKTKNAREQEKESEIPTPTTKTATASATTPKSSVGGFPFQIGEKPNQPLPATDSGKGGFPFEFGTKTISTSKVLPDPSLGGITVDATKTTTSSTVPEKTTPTKETTSSTLTTSTSLSLGNIPSTVPTTVPTATAGGPPDLLGGVVDKKLTAVTFNLGTEDKDKTVSLGETKDKATVPPFSLATTQFGLKDNTDIEVSKDKGLTTTKDSNKVSVSDSTIKTVDKLAMPGFTFGAPATNSTSAKPAAAAFSFGSIPVPGTTSTATTTKSTVAPISTTVTTESKTETTFSFGADKLASKITSAPVSASSLGTVASNSNSATFAFGQTATAVTTSSTTTFSFGQTAAVAPKVVTTSSEPAPTAKSFTFGSSTAEMTSPPAGSPFTFGSTAPKPVTTTAASTTVDAASPFTFNAAPSTKEAPGISAAPTQGGGSMFQFGTGQFGAVTKAPAAATTAVAPTFGSTTKTAAPSFSFGAQPPTTNAAPTAAFQFGAVATTAAVTTASAQPSFTFGKTAEVPKPSFAFGGAGTNAPATAVASPFGAPAPSFGASNTFGGPVPSTSSNTFGTPSVTKTASAGSVFTFGKGAPATEPAAASAAPSPFSFGAANTASGAGAAAVPSAAASPFSFGGQSAPPAASKASTFSFGGGAAPAPAAAAPQAGGVFNFGGASAQPPAAAPAQPSTGFNFAAVAQSPPQAGVFNFGASAAAAPQANNPFGAAPTNTQAPATFGAPAPTFGAPAPTFGATSPSFGAVPAQQQQQQQGQAGGGNMFSIGAGGNNQNRSSARRIAVPRRTRK